MAGCLLSETPCNTSFQQLLQHLLQNDHVHAGASVDSYFLGGYDSSAVQPPGKFKVLSMQAQASTTGRLQAYFEVVLTQKANALKATPLDVIYAVGEVSKEEIQASPSLLAHRVLLLLGPNQSCLAQVN